MLGNIPECGPGFGDGNDGEAQIGGKQANEDGGQVCGTGLGACCAGSNDGCPPEAPICSEYGYCQCSSYQPGGPECGPGFDGRNVIQEGNDEGQEYSNTNPESDNNQLYEDDENNNDEILDYDDTEQITRRSIPGGEENEDGGQVCGTGQGACCAGSNDGCPPEAPICSEYGYCQCSSYQSGGSACGPGFP